MPRRFGPKALAPFLAFFVYGCAEKGFLPPPRDHPASVYATPAEPHPDPGILSRDGPRVAPTPPEMKEKEGRDLEKVKGLVPIPEGGDA